MCTKSLFRSGVCHRRQATNLRRQNGFFDLAPGSDAHTHPGVERHAGIDSFPKRFDLTLSKTIADSMLVLTSSKPLILLGVPLFMLLLWRGLRPCRSRADRVYPAVLAVLWRVNLTDFGV